VKKAGNGSHSCATVLTPMGPNLLGTAGDWMRAPKWPPTCWGLLRIQTARKNVQAELKLKPRLPAQYAIN
jgi:hypothetical protein